MATRFAVRARDGVDISVQQVGDGPALLLVHGALLNGTIPWAAVLPSLAQQFTVYAMDRRGRAPSGDGAEYSIGLEADDIGRVVAAIGQPTIVVAHSYGALAALEAIGGLKGVARFILYEPPVRLSPESESDVVEKMERALAAHDNEEIVRLFLREQIGAPQEVFEGFKASPIWPIVLQIAPTLPRESREVNTHRLSGERLAACRIPTVMLLGSETQGFLREGVEWACRTIPGCRIIALEGEGHNAMTSAPQLFVEKVLEAVHSVDQGR